MQQAISPLRVGPNPVLRLQRKILIVDDDARDLLLYYSILCGHGYVVWPVSSYTEGVASVGKLDLDLVLVSQGSPSFEGRSVVERAIARSRRLPVVVLAAQFERNCYLEAIQLGAVDYLQKLREPDEIYALVRRRLRSSLETDRGPVTGRQQIERSELIH